MAEGRVRVRVWCVVWGGGRLAGGVCWGLCWWEGAVGCGVVAGRVMVVVKRVVEEGWVEEGWVVGAEAEVGVTGWVVVWGSVVALGLAVARDWVGVVE